MPHGRLVGEGWRKRLERNAVSAAARQALGVRQEARHIRPARELRRERGGVSELAEERLPLTFAGAGYLVGKKAHRLAPLERSEQLAHAAEIRRHETHAAAAAAGAHQRIEPRKLWRAVENRDGKLARRILRGDLEASHVRREEEERLALRARRLDGLHSIHRADQRRDLILWPQPHGGRLEEHLSGVRDRRTTHARIAIAGAFQVLAQVAPVGGRYPIHRPAEQASHAL